MKSYVVIDTEIIDREAYSEYVERIPAVISAHGGRFLVRTSQVEAIHGGWEPKRFVILEFDTLEAAKGFVGSADYRALDDLRRQAANSRTVVVEGSDSEA